ncbi:expressed conserved protein [Echinococcus multilocularis]|uniref:Expressed conserved protein n=1 Tax=Echinococcus multilocularis TaxID=6211 RepID=U6HNN3_ECHMU|nr:expressed conserved protein [Echinococcus multilocularis]CDS38230.1 expressed conserved protein [Echinococcus multilocularis]
MDYKQISLLCFFFSVTIACMSKEEEVDVELSAFGTTADKCPEVVDATKEMPTIVDHLVRKVCNGMIFTLRGMGQKARGECGKAFLQSQCSPSKNSSTQFECSVIAHHLRFDCASHTGPLSAEAAKLINDHYVDKVVVDIVVEQQEEGMIRVVDATAFEADVSGMRGISGLSETALQKAIFAGLKAAAGRLSCSLT